jgi:hypothetical protein
LVQLWPQSQRPRISCTRPGPQFDWLRTVHLHAIYIIAGPIDKTGMGDGSKKVNLRMGSGCDRLALENNCVTAGGLDDVPTKIFGRCLARLVRTMFIDQRADSKWRINIGGKTPLSQVVQNVHKKILQGRERWVCMVMSCSRWEDPWTWDEDKGLLAWPTESGWRDEEEEKRRRAILKINDANRGTKFRSGTVTLVCGRSVVMGHVRV